ncbi:multidrug ABC transporter permease, partial [Veillonellaceae bacterium M2-4]|nr:multidrug ABC transporter permease [Veillonellaceae bacterium M2-4]
LELILTYLLVTIFFVYISKILTKFVINRAFKENRLGVF